MYWVVDGDDKYEVLDGQQRTLSIMNFLKHQFTIELDGKTIYWDSLTDDQYKQLMNYKINDILVYWFRF